MSKFKRGDRVAVKSAHPDCLVPQEANPKATYPADKWTGPLRMSPYLKERMEEGDLLVVAPEDLGDTAADRGAMNRARTSESPTPDDAPNPDGDQAPPPDAKNNPVGAAPRGRPAEDKKKGGKK